MIVKNTASVDTTHLEYDSNQLAWMRARDVIAGEDAVKAAGERYLPRLESQTDEEYHAYKARAAFFNATARAAEGYLGLVFRRPPFIKIPDSSSALGKALANFNNDADMLGNSLANYAKNIVSEVIAVGRAGTLVDWEGDVENRVYVSSYAAENILNWRMERINGRSLLTMVVLRETGLQRTEDGGQRTEGDEFEENYVDQVRVLKLVESSLLPVEGKEMPRFHKRSHVCQVDIWQRSEKKGKGNKRAWEKVETRIPLRLGKPLPLIPFVFHSPRHSMPSVEKLPLGDVIAVNLDHYRLDADYKHGMHFTALPTAWVSGFDKSATLRIGASTAWVTETPGATAGFLEYTGQGLTTFERAMDRDERLMAILGARLLESQKKVAETAESIELRQTGENSILGSLASSVSASLTQVLQWGYWWNSTEEFPEDVTKEQATLELNSDFSSKGFTAQELATVVSAWQQGAISRDTMFDLFRRNEILPEGRTNEEEGKLIVAGTSIQLTHR